MVLAPEAAQLQIRCMTWPTPASRAGVFLSGGTSSSCCQPREFGLGGFAPPAALERATCTAVNKLGLYYRWAFHYDPNTGRNITPCCDGDLLINRKPPRATAVADGSNVRFEYPGQVGVECCWIQMVKYHVDLLVIRQDARRNQIAGWVNSKDLPGPPGGWPNAKISGNGGNIATKTYQDVKPDTWYVDAQDPNAGQSGPGIKPSTDPCYNGSKTTGGPSTLEDQPSKWSGYASAFIGLTWSSPDGSTLVSVGARVVLDFVAYLVCDGKTLLKVNWTMRFFAFAGQSSEQDAYQMDGPFVTDPAETDLKHQKAIDDYKNGGRNGEPA